MSGEEEGEGEGKGTNLFNNDGSFMEQFMKMQQEQSGSQSKSTEGDAPPTGRSVSMKLAPIKKKPAPTSLIQKRIQSRAVRKAFSDGEDETASTDPSATLSATVADVKSSASPSAPALGSTSTSSKVGGRKRKSKWDVGGPESSDSRAIHEAIGSFMVHPTSTSHTPTPSGQQLTSAQLEQIKEQIAMQKMVAEIKSATQQGVSSKQNRYEYDSDEETEGGTWEHKARTKEMKTTEEQAKDLTEMGKGKHHIGDFLPPEELEKFIETVSAVKEDRTPDFSDYKEHKLTEDNIGFKMLQKSGWDEGTGLGAQQQGITAPVNKGKQSFDQSGVGAVKPADVKKTDDEFDVYRKRMMLAYRFRPNPLNNPRRPYY